MDETYTPLVTVIIPTYNYSSVLSYAIQSVLWQTFQDFEIWVIGDGCTDDSEAVVQAFGDARIHWHNLPENSGSQSLPNNEGLRRARGKYIAYLGHDDLWYPDHLAVLVEALESSGADGAHTLVMMIQPQDPQHTLYGLASSKEREALITLPPSCLIHLRRMTEDSGEWKDYRSLRIPPDIEFVARAVHAGKRFVSVMELTVFKFPSSRRENAYNERPSHEQAAYAERIRHEPELRYHEVMAVIGDWATVRRALEMTFAPTTLKPGELVEGWRAIRGLAAQAPYEAPPLSEDIVVLTSFNLLDDITPATSAEYLHRQKKLPKNGVLIGAGWYGLERDAEGKPFRWVKSDAELILTHMDQHPWRLSMDVWLGYGNEGQPVTVALAAPDGILVDQKVVTKRTRLAFEIVPPGETVTYTLRVVDSRNTPLPNDPRILNIGVGALRLEAVEGEADRSRPARRKFLR